jgi:alpha-L-fucosidase
MVQFGDGRDWFFEKRFGLFLHWGLYAMRAWHEQDQYRRRIPRDTYAAQFHEFNPANFDPDAWLDIAEQAGMSYVCFTTKHIDGFCMWNTAQTDYSVTRTPYGRDVLAMLAEACHRRGFPLCLYYSVVDMHHPNYPNQNRSYELERPEPGDQPDQERYLAFVREQVRELCTQYGELGGFWWDANIIQHHDPSFNAMIRALQPNAVINNRGFDEGDVGTPERDWDDSVNTLPAFERPTEACQSVGMESWGFRADEDYYTTAYLIRSIDKVLAKGGNYLLNVGPQSDGALPAEPAAMLREIGRWYHSVKEAFDDVQPAPLLAENRDVLLTRQGDTLYVHLYKVPASARVLLKPITQMPRRVTLLSTGEPVEARVELLPSQHHDGGAYLCLHRLPVDRFTHTVPIVKLEGV